jgi:asparagine synthase (glutamine-hydrolysing)
MCGVAGVAGSPDLGLVERMLDRLEHRGPDDRGTWSGGAVALGAVRLAIIDPTPAGHQPMANEDSSVVVAMNGEVYNHAALRDELARSGRRFRGRSDTEVVLRAWEAWGPRALQRFDGMFALAVVDRRDGEGLWLARDRSGEKPLYWAEVAGSVAFASEAKALLLHPRVPREMDPEALSTYLAVGWVPSPLTMFAGVRKLEPAEVIEVRGGAAPRRDRYWSPGPIHRGASPSREQVREAVVDAVRARLVSDVPLGVFLSGGVDSTIVTAIAARELGGPVRTFSAAYDVGPRSAKYNVDADAAEGVARRFGTAHTRLTLRAREGLMDHLACVVDHLDEPVANPTAVTTSLLAREVRAAGVTVMLTGDGSDEIFGGYERYRAERRVGRLRRVPPPARRALAAALRRAGRRAEPAARALAKADAPAGGLDAVMSWWRLFDEGERARLLDPAWDVHPATLERRALAAVREADPPTAEDAIAAFDRAVWLADESNLRVDKTTMAHSIEARAAFEGHPLVELAARIPLARKAGRLAFAPKCLLKDAFADLLPPDVARREKWGWFSPVHYWVNDDVWDELAALARSLRGTGAFTGAVDDLVRVRPTQQPLKVWSLAVLALWHRRFVGAG